LNKKLSFFVGIQDGNLRLLKTEKIIGKRKSLDQKKNEKKIYYLIISYIIIFIITINYHYQWKIL